MGFTAIGICTGSIIRQFTVISYPNFVCCLMKETRAESLLCTFSLSRWNDSGFKYSSIYSCV